MRLAPVPRPSLVAPLLLLLALATACGSSDSATEPNPPETQTATASASPTAVSVARGASSTVTVTYRATGGLIIGQTYTINFPIEGFSVDQVSSVTAAPTITTVYRINAGATVPTGTYSLRFSTPVSGYTGTGSVPTSIVATVAVTVTN